MQHFKNQLIFSNYSFSSLTLFEIQKNCADAFEPEREDANKIQAHAIELNSGLFINPASTIEFPAVALATIDRTIILECSCQSNKKRLCHHMALVLFAVIERPEYRIFFDERFRQSKLIQLAKEYGLEQEKDLDAYFSISYSLQGLLIEPKIKDLAKINFSELKQKLLPQHAFKIEESIPQQNYDQLILLFRKQKYQNPFVIELATSAISKNGKLKNTISLVESSKLIWKTAVAEELKFFAAVAKLETNQSEEMEASEMEALKVIVANPLGLKSYYHDRSISENLVASSLNPVSLRVAALTVELFVFKKEPFYEITGGVWLNDIYISFSYLNIQFACFILYQPALHLITDTDILRVIKFFKSNNQIFLIHSSKFEEFKQSILVNLESKLKINYAYIQPAVKKQLEEQQHDKENERIIYLTDRHPFIAITPVIKYGSIEIPVFSKKQIYDRDLNGNEFKVERNNQQEIQFTGLILQQHSYFAEQLEHQEYFYLHKDRFMENDWFLDAFETWRKNGITILGFNELKKNKLNANKAVISINVVSGIDWFNAELKVKYGKQQATLKQLHKSIRTKNKYVQLDDGTQGIIPEDWFKKFANYFEVGEIDGNELKFSKNNFSEIKKLFDKEILSQEIETELKQYEQAFAEGITIPSIDVPEEFQGALRDYQRQGLNWLNYLDDFNFGGCLADDMGLGKTIQILAFILSQRKKHSMNCNLVIVPTSLLFNWQAEVEKFAPSIRLFTHYGTNRIKSSKHLGDYELVLTTYGMLLSDIRFLKDFTFNYIFLDESQAIKNPNSERYTAARLLKSRNKIVMTGTPIENNTFDIYGQLSFACPGLLGSKQYFRAIYSIPIDKFSNSKRAKELQQRINPFILRRTKKQVAKELPEKTEIVIYCEMDQEQRLLYDSYEKELREYISAESDAEILKNSMHVLTGLTKLRQLCNSPLLLKDGNHLVNSSAKMDVLMEQIENKSSQHKILVFSQFVAMLDLIKTQLQQRQIPFEYLSGKTKDRQARVANFQENDETRVFLISLKAGGTGLNLTQADYVYLVDPWWNPAVENQAIDRSYRIGQEKNVMAVRLICQNTVEEKIMKMQQSKKELASDLIQTDQAFFSSLTKKELLNLL
ncbi:DEAD/DEAH box helicase [Sphingobacterium hungaricum]|uniref:DNA helicase n=1 Tax=Sphingobacterium hungaricum TaxID=2082723 RepID=A0A928UWW2_9SPHI|nr:DEAD/DEAH box helicase [Sphingobacterium hungaricum]MBE8712084.1 DNA helicase [Sphingobacterium hungaricum]